MAAGGVAGGGGGGSGGGSGGGGSLGQSLLGLFGLGSSSSSPFSLQSLGSASGSLTGLYNAVSSLFGGGGGGGGGSDDISFAPTPSGETDIPETAPGGALGEPLEDETLGQLQNAAEDESLSFYGVDENSSSAIPAEPGFETPFFLGGNDNAIGGDIDFPTGQDSSQLYSSPSGEAFTYQNTSTNTENEEATDLGIFGADLGAANATGGLDFGDGDDDF